MGRERKRERGRGGEKNRLFPFLSFPSLSVSSLPLLSTPRACSSTATCYLYPAPATHHTLRPSKNLYRPGEQTANYKLPNPPALPPCHLHRPSKPENHVVRCLPRMLGEKLVMLRASASAFMSVSRGGVGTAESVFPRLRPMGGVSGVWVQSRRLVGRRGGVFSDSVWRHGEVWVAAWIRVLSTLSMAGGRG
jgi:hypothetical protein